MKSASVNAIAKGIGDQSDANDKDEIINALYAILLVSSGLNLQKTWMTHINKDAIQYFKDSLLAANPTNIAPDPSKPGFPYNGSGAPMSPIAAMDNQNKTMDTKQQDLENDKINTLLEEVKSTVRYDGSNMGQVFQLERPVKELMDQALNLMKRF